MAIFSALAFRWLVYDGAETIAWDAVAAKPPRDFNQAVLIAWFFCAPIAGPPVNLA